MAYEIALRIVAGRKAVGTPGIAEKFVAVSTYCYRIDVCADIGNTNPVVIGGSDVVAASGSQKGIILIPGNPPITILIDDVSKVYVDAITAADAVCFTYYANP